MKRRFKAVAVVMTVCLAFSGCGNSDDEEDATENSTTGSEGESTSDPGSEPEKSSVDRTYEATVTFSQQSGIYPDAFELNLETDAEGDIYYTTDGTDPATSTSRQVYEGSVQVAGRSAAANIISAISPSLFCTNFSDVVGDEAMCYMEAPEDSAVDKCTVVQAVVESEDDTYSKTYSQTYFMGTAEEHIQGLKESCEAAGQDLAVISISMNQDDLFDSETGIYVKGDIFDESLKSYIAENGWADGEACRKLAANYNQKGREWERAAHIDFFEMNADSSTNVLSQDCGIRIQGNYSRSDLQKSFRLYARTDYGENNFNYNVFGDSLTNSQGEVIDKFKTLILRDGGNCTFTAKYNDTYWQSLVGDLDCDTKASRPCVVYLNGEYWGLYVLEEDYSNDYYEDHYGVNKDDVVIYKGDAETYVELGYKLDEGTLPEGETDESYFFKELTDFFASHDSLASQEDYDEFAKLVDVQSAMDYFAVEVWMNNKWDWPGKNWSMWKTSNVDEANEYADGKWRFSFYDMEFGGVSGSADAYTNTIKEDNYETYGLLDMDTKNPAVLCFAYLMTNESFRTAYCQELLDLSDTVFEKTAAITRLTAFEEIYGPLLDQFFARYPDTGDTSNALYGGYASSQCISDFVNLRAENIQSMIDWVDEHFK